MIDINAWLPELYVKTDEQLRSGYRARHRCERDELLSRMCADFERDAEALIDEVNDGLSLRLDSRTYQQTLAFTRRLKEVLRHIRAIRRVNEEAEELLKSSEPAT